MEAGRIGGGEQSGYIAGGTREEVRIFKLSTGIVTLAFAGVAS
jgi:hypothetical protein